MIYSSDNYSPVPPEVLEALVDANEGYQPSYGADSQMTKVRHLIQKIFEAPDAAVYLVATGTAANSLILLPCVNLGKQYFVAQYHIFMRMSVMHQSFFLGRSSHWLVIVIKSTQQS